MGNKGNDKGKNKKLTKKEKKAQSHLKLMKGKGEAPAWENDKQDNKKAA